MTDIRPTTAARTAAPYDASSIVVFSGLEAVRRNPSMYIGSTTADGLHHLVFELLDNAVDEFEAGHCREVTVTLDADGGCAVADDGRGVPVDPHPDSGRPACEVVLTTLHAGGKFTGASYTHSAGLHGVGLSCVNALAQWLRADIRRDGGHHRQEFARGEALGELTRLGPAADTGTTITFRPDPAIFDTTDFSAHALCERLQEIAFLHPGLTVRLADERTGQHVEFRFEGGVRAFLARLNENATATHPTPVVIAGRADEADFDVALQWTEGYTEEIRSFVNGVRTDQGGSHVDGIRVALAHAINGFASAHGMLDEHTGERITTVDVLEGLTAVVSLRMGAPASTARPRSGCRTRRSGPSCSVGWSASSAGASSRTRISGGASSPGPWTPPVPVSPPGWPAAPPASSAVNWRSTTRSTSASSASGPATGTTPASG